jgi:uncharacterized protein
MFSNSVLHATFTALLIGSRGWLGRRTSFAIVRQFASVSTVLSLALLLFGSVPGGAEPSGPSFDCSKATGSLETTICAEQRLAALDIRLASLFNNALRSEPDDAGMMRQIQRDWLKRRNKACISTTEIRECLDGYYRSRIAQLVEEQRLRDEVLGHQPASPDYSAFVGRWRVYGVKVGPDSGNITNYVADDPQYVGLELMATPNTLRWLNPRTPHPEICQNPRFLPRHVPPEQIPVWKTVTLRCKSGRWDGDDGLFENEEGAISLKAADLAELEWEDGALLQLRRVPLDAPAAPPYKAAPAISPQGYDGSGHSAGDRAYFVALRDAVHRHDGVWIAAHALGGINVNRPNGASYCYSRQEIVDAYDWIFTPKIVKAILAQSPDKLWKNYRGVMIGNGQLWFDQAWDGESWQYTIIAINQ